MGQEIRNNFILTRFQINKIDTRQKFLPTLNRMVSPLEVMGSTKASQVQIQLIQSSEMSTSSKTNGRTAIRIVFVTFKKSVGTD